MIGGYVHFVEISKPNIYLRLYRGFLEIQEKKARLGRIPLDDILGLVITGYGCSHSSNILTSLAERGIPVSICGSHFLPKALILPVVGNSRQSLRMRAQAQASKPLKKKLWKQIVQTKIQNQAFVLKENGLVYEGLLNMSKRVRSGDPENVEAQCAKRYWATLFHKDFKRDKAGDGINAMLNYGYAVIRSCVARGIVGAGLHPGLGLHHHNIYNSMCLVDDLMEPFRPVVDYIVKQLISNGWSEVNPEVKQILAKIAVVDMMKDTATPLFQVVAHFSTSLAMFLSNEKQEKPKLNLIHWKNFELDAMNMNFGQLSA